METIEIKSPKRSESVTVEDRPSSPNDCAICLEQLTDKSFTNSCLHMFCFHCLLAWSKVKPECPLCKQDFCSIIHNIRSMDDYDEYSVPPAAMRFATPDSTPFLPSIPRPDMSDLLPRTHDFFSTNRRFFSYSTTLLSGGFSVPRQRSSSLVIQPYVDNLQIQNEFPHIIGASRSFSRLNRKEVYLKGLETRPPTVGRHRISTPEFYRENESQMHRLGRWLIRELVAISQLGMRFNPHQVLSVIMELLQVHAILSTTFRNMLYPYIGIYTIRFVREFYNFAISPYEMEQYDRECVYVRQRTGSQLAFIVTVGGDDSEDVQVIPSPPVDHSHAHSRWFPFGYPRNTVSQPPSRVFSCPSNRPSTSHQVIHISDSENDDCVIINEGRRTPETIVLDDSDMEVIPTPTAKSPKPMKNEFTSPIDLSYQPSTSGISSDNKFKLTLPSSSKTDSNSNDFIANSIPSTSSYSASREKTQNSFRKRSCSNSSVISTDGSIVESEHSTCSESFRRHKKKNRRQHRKITCPKKSYVFSDSSSTMESDKDDLDYEETISLKRKKRTKKYEKCDKKSKKRHKVTRIKSTKKKKSPTKNELNCSCTIAEPPKNESEWFSSKSYNLSNPYPEYDHPVNGDSYKPKLKSVVKKVNKNETLAAKVESEKKFKKSGLVDDFLGPSSSGYRSMCSTRLSNAQKRRYTSSDSD